MALAAAVAEEKENDLFRPPVVEEKDLRGRQARAVKKP